MVQTRYYEAGLKLGRSQKYLTDVFASSKSLWPLLDELEERIDKGLASPELQAQLKQIVHEDFKANKKIPVHTGRLKAAMSGESPKGLWYFGAKADGNTFTFGTTLPYFNKVNRMRTVKFIKSRWESKLSKLSLEQRRKYYKRTFKARDLTRISAKAEKRMGTALLKFITRDATKRQQKDLSKLYFTDL